MSFDLFHSCLSFDFVSLCTSSPFLSQDALNSTETHGQQLHYGYEGFDPSINSAPDFHDQKLSSNLDITSQYDYIFSEVRQELDNSPSTKLDSSEEIDNFAEFSTPSSVRVPPSAFLGPKCALWDCTRPAQGSEWYLDYCSNYHGTLALNEDSPGTAPVLRPGGISLKDNLLIDALRAKTQGKNVGIPVCEGAVNTKCPWNAAGESIVPLEPSFASLFVLVQHFVASLKTEALCEFLTFA